MFNIFKGVPLLTLIFSLINGAYMYFMGPDMYSDFIMEDGISMLLLAYCGWAMMAYTLRRFVVKQKGFGFKSVFTSGPALGLAIYLAINVSLLSTVLDYSLDKAFTDIMFGTIMFMMVTFFCVIFEKFV